MEMFKDLAKELEEGGFGATPIKDLLAKLQRIVYRISAGELDPKGLG